MGDAKPVAKRFIRVLEDRPGEMGKPIASLRSALVALPMPRIALQFGNFRTAPGATDAFWPTPTDEIGATSVLIWEHSLELGGGKLLDRLGLLSVGHDGSPSTMGGYCHA